MRNFIEDTWRGSQLADVGQRQARVENRAEADGGRIQTRLEVSILLGVTFDEKQL